MARIGIFAVFALVALTACSGASPATPSVTVALRSVRYVRTYPVVDAQVQSVHVICSLPIPGDQLRRTRILRVSLTQMDKTTFNLDNIRTFAEVPIDSEVRLEVADLAVRPTGVSVARDLFVNDTRIRVQTESTANGPIEMGLFKVRRDGTVY